MMRCQILGIKKDKKTNKLVPRNISIGKAITSDPKRPGKAHISSILYTKISSIICYILSILVIIRYLDNFKLIFNNFFHIG